MGLTKSDRNKRIYKQLISQGLTHGEVIDKVPLKIKSRFLLDLNLSTIQSHLGIK